jgi:hypothetical protein
MAKQLKPSNTAPDATGAKSPVVTGTTKQPQTGLAPKPRRAPTTGPKIASPSANYDAGQQKEPAVTHLGASARDYADQQAQQLQDKGGA